MTKQYVAHHEIWEEHFEIASYHMDPFGYLKLSSLFELLQDAASRDAARKGFGYHQLLANNRYWVLLRALLHIERLPRWEERVCFKTWPKESTGVVAFRDFTLESDEGELLLKATSTWSQLNAESRRPVRIEVGRDYQPIIGRSAIDDRPARVDLPADLEYGDPIEVKYSQIDVNKHVNNTRYLEWVLNEMPYDFLRDRQIKGLEVNFLSEGMLGDYLRTGIKKSSETEYFGCVERVAEQQKLYAVRFLFGRGAL